MYSAKYRIADKVFLIKTKYTLFHELSLGYDVPHDTDVDYTITITDDDIDFEKKNQDETYQDSIHEMTAVLRKVLECLPKDEYLLIHGSCVVVNDFAYIFTAHSGVGKSTHTNNYLKTIKGSYILNGDKPIVRRIGNELYAYGTPWCGKERLNRNERKEVKGISILSRDSFNHTESITIDDSISDLIQLIYQKENENTLEFIERIKNILSPAFLYRTYCTKDESSALESYQKMKGGDASVSNLKESDCVSSFDYDSFKSLILLIREAITNNSFDSPIQNWENVYQLSAKHMTSSLIADVAKNHDCPKDIEDKLNDIRVKTIKRTLLFDMEREKILKEFDKKEIEYLPLKGILLENMYPVYGMREFSDNDILIMGDKRKVDEIFRSFGYSMENGIVHDAYKKEPIYNFEIHKKLFDEEISDTKYFDDIWDKAIKNEEGSGYHLNEMDFYLYFLAHFKKHLENSGTGLRYFTDFYILDKKMNDSSRKIFNERLVTTNLSKFYERIRNISYSMFEGNVEDIDKETLEYIAVSGAYGIIEYNVRNEVSKKGKTRYLIEILFPRFNQMCMAYPCLSKFPILLPFMWLIRIISKLFKKDALKRNIHRLKIMNKIKKEKV